MFTELKIQNFRGIRNLEITSLNKINIFVGINGSGKSTVLDAIFISINPNNTQLIPNTNLFRGIDPNNFDYLLTYFHYFNLKKEIEIILKNNNTRRIKISPSIKKDFNIVSFEKEFAESIIADKKDDEIISSSSNAKNIIVGLKTEFEVKNKKYNSSFIFQPQGLFKFNEDENFIPDISGHYHNSQTLTNINLANSFGQLIRDKKKNDIVKFLKLFEPEISEINMDESKNIVANDDRFDKAVNINLYGSGLTKSLHIYMNSLLENNNIVLIDEIENGLHYTNQQILWEAILKIVENSDKQFFVTTHSYEIIKCLVQLLEERNLLQVLSLFRLEQVNNQIEAVTYSKEEIKYTILGSFEVR